MAAFVWPSSHSGRSNLLSLGRCLCVFIRQLVDRAAAAMTVACGLDEHALLCSKLRLLS